MRNQPKSRFGRGLRNCTTNQGPLLLAAGLQFNPEELLYEYARITRAVSLSGEWHNRDEVDRAVRLCKRVNQTKPKVRATIGINYFPWHRRFGKDLAERVDRAESMCV